MSAQPDPAVPATASRARTAAVRLATAAPPTTPATTPAGAHAATGAGAGPLVRLAHVDIRHGAAETLSDVSLAIMP
ncbi:MAG: hypothetical protein AAFV86_24070, partial [Pseudomonadota bacterium]